MPTNTPGPANSAGDEDLMARAAGGDNRAFEQIFHRFWKPVLSFLARLTGDLAEAEDLAQEAFLRILRHRSDYDPSRSFRVWLFTIARRLAYNRLRKSTPEAETELVEQMASSSDGPVDLLVREEAAEAAREALGRLPPLYREVVLLRLFEGLAYRDIAVVVGSNESTVRTRMNSAARALKRILGQG